MLEGILLILRTRCPRQDLLDRYPVYQTCHRGSHFLVKAFGEEMNTPASSQKVRDIENAEV